MSNPRKSLLKRTVSCASDEILTKKRKLSEDIHKAVSEYDYEKLSQLIDSMGTPDVPNDEGQTPLYVVSVDGSFVERDRKMIEFLIKMGADVLYYSSDAMYTPAAFIFQYEDQPLIDLILSKIENVNEPLDRWLNTALHFAVRGGNRTTILKLLKRGADPNLKNYLNIAPIHEAITLNCYQLLRILVDHKGDINLKGKLGMTPLHLAALLGESNILDEVLKCKPDINAKDENRNTALALFLMDKKNLYGDQIDKYIIAGADLELRDQHGMNVLHRVVLSSGFQNVEELVYKIIDNGVDINAKTSGDKSTALHLAAQTDHKIVYILLSKKANLYATNSRGRTPLDNAVFGGRIQTIEMILSFAVRWNLPEKGLMLGYHKSTNIYKNILVIHKRCQEEFQKAKHMKLGCYPRFCYKDLLFLDERRFARILYNKEVSAELITNIENFESFKYSFRKVYQKSKIRRDSEDAALYHLYMFWNYNLPQLCIENILSNMDTKDLIPFLHL